MDPDIGQDAADMDAVQGGADRSAAKPPTCSSGASASQGTTASAVTWSGFDELDSTLDLTGSSADGADADVDAEPVSDVAATDEDKNRLRDKVISENFIRQFELDCEGNEVPLEKYKCVHCPRGSNILSTKGGGPTK
jgi:hypothetical protein